MEDDKSLRIKRDLPKMGKLKEEYSNMANDLNFVFLWMQRELLASQTLSDLALKNKRKEERKKSPTSPKTFQGNESSSSKEEEEEESDNMDEEKKQIKETTTESKDGWEQYIPPSSTTCTTLETINTAEKTVMENPNSAKLLGDEMLDIAQALEDLHCEGGKKRSTNGPVESQVGPKPKKRRRRRHEIARNFKCTLSSCTKSYGSEGALKTHIRLKHTEGTDNKKKDKEKNKTPWGIASTAGAQLLVPRVPHFANPNNSLAGENLPLPPRLTTSLTETARMEDTLRLPPPKFGQGFLSLPSELPPFHSLIQSTGLGM